jgi:hypothetical protein
MNRTSIFAHPVHARGVGGAATRQTKTMSARLPSGTANEKGAPT